MIWNSNLHKSRLWGRRFSDNFEADKTSANFGPMAMGDAQGLADGQFFFCVSFRQKKILY